MNSLNMEINTLKWILLTVTVVHLSTLAGQSLAPSVLASSGGYDQAEGGYSFSWTLGETMTAPLTNGNLQLTQGFQQPDLETTSARFNWDNQAITIYLFPNPAEERAFLVPSGDGSFAYRVTSVNGQVLHVLAPAPGQREVDLTSWSSGLYLIQVWKDDHLLGSLKFIKSR